VYKDRFSVPSTIRREISICHLLVNKSVVYSEEWHEFTQLVTISHMFTGLCCTYI